MSDEEKLVLETRAEQLTLLSRGKVVREGESDQFEVGHGGASDTVLGTEAVGVGGNATEHANSRVSQAERLERSIDGKMTLRAYSDTTMMAGAMTDVQTGPILVLAGMSDDLVVGGGMRLSLVDLWVCGLIGMEENPLSVHADAIFLEGYRTHFEREYGAGIHLVGSATFTGALHTTMATGFRALATVALGVRNMSPGGGSADTGTQASPPVAGAPPPIDPPQPSTSNPQILTAADDAEQVGEIAHVDAAADAAQSVEVQSIDDLNDSAGVLEDLRQADPNPPPGYPAPPPPDNEYDQLGRFTRGTGLPDDAQEYAELTIYTTPQQVLEVGDAGRFDEGVIPGWIDNANDFEESLIPVPPLDYETPLGIPLPENFNYLEEMENFRVNLQADYRDEVIPGLSIMQTALNDSADLPWLHLRTMDPQWLADAGINSDELARLRLNSADAYQKIVDMEAAARAVGDVEKADALRKALQDIDTRSFVLWQNAMTKAEEIRSTGFLPLPGNVDVDSVIADLQARLADIQQRSAEAMAADDMDQMRQLSLEGTFYSTTIKNLQKGYDPTPYLMELSRSTILSIGDDVDQVAMVQLWREDVFAILGDTKHLFNTDLPSGFFFDPGEAITMPLDVGDNWRKLHGIPDSFDYAQYRNYLLNLRLDDASEVEFDQVLKALENIEEGPLTQLDNLPADYFYETGTAADLAAIRESQDPVEAYRLLEQMEAFYRQAGDAATAEDLAKADHLRSILDNIDAMVVDEYSKIYDLLQQISAGNSANAPVPFILDPRALLPSGADDVDEVENARLGDSPDTIYSLLSEQNMGAEEAGTFDDVQAGLDLRADQVDVEVRGLEDPMFVNVGGADGEYDDIVVVRRGGDTESPIPVNVVTDGEYDDIVVTRPVGDIEEATGDVYFSGNVDPGDVEGLDDEPIYGDFTFRDHRMIFGDRTVEPDNYQLMTEEEWLEAARGKYKRATADDWAAATNNQVSFVIDVDDDPLKFADDTPNPASVDDPVEVPPSQVGDADPNTGVRPPDVDDPPPVRDPDVDNDYALLGNSRAPSGSFLDPETGMFTVPPVDTRIEGGFLMDNADLVGSTDNVTTQGDEIYEITRRRIEIAEEGVYNTLLYGFQQQAPDSIYSRLDELQMGTDFVDAPRSNYVNVDYDGARTILIDTFDSATDVVTPPGVQPNGLDRPAVIRMQVEGDVIITVVDFADDALDSLPPVSVGPNDSQYELLSPVLTSDIDVAVGPAIRRPDGSVAVIEDIWESTDPLTTVLNRELHRVVPDTFESAESGTDLSRIHETVNSFVNVNQSPGAAFNLADVTDLDDLEMFNEVRWQVAADPVLDPQIHQMSIHGDNVVAELLDQGGLGMRPRSLHW